VDALASRYQTAIDQQTHIIDIGAGYGGSARWLAKKFGCLVTCLNLSEEQNNRNRAMSAEQNLDDRIVVVDGSFENIPATNEFFDLAWSQDAILHSGQRERVLDEVDRVLKPGGEFIFTDPMQADNCPDGVLQPVLDRIHLDSLGSFAFYRQQASRLGWEELGVFDLTPQLVTHYTRVQEELTRQRNRLAGKVSDKYMFNMLQGLDHWIKAGKKGYLSWGILHFRKPGLNAAA
jgi:sarcosine/dimethylglycine N-methyltransferase